MAVGFPTARYRGPIALSLSVEGRPVFGRTVKSFLTAVVDHIIESNRFYQLELPFCTSGNNYLIAETPKHPGGRLFAAYTSIATPAGGIIFVNVNHPRFFALRQGARLLKSVGFEPAIDSTNVAAFPD